jgi:hypothetical protein
MAYIKERGAYWRAEVRRKGYKPTYRTFDTQKQAQQWARRIESEMDAGLYIDKGVSFRASAAAYLGLSAFRRDRPLVACRANFGRRSVNFDRSSIKPEGMDLPTACYRYGAWTRWSVVLNRT